MIPHVAEFSLPAALAAVAAPIKARGLEPSLRALMGAATR